MYQALNPRSTPAQWQHCCVPRTKATDAQKEGAIVMWGRTEDMCPPARLVDEVPVEDGGVLLVQAAVVGVAAVNVVLDVVLVHLAAVPVGVEVVGGLGGGGPVDVAVQGQPVVLRAPPVRGLPCKVVVIFSAASGKLQEPTYVKDFLPCTLFMSWSSVGVVASCRDTLHPDRTLHRCRAAENTLINIQSLQHDMRYMHSRCPDVVAQACSLGSA